MDLAAEVGGNPGGLGSDYAVNVPALQMGRCVDLAVGAI